MDKSTMKKKKGLVILKILMLLIIIGLGYSTWYYRQQAQQAAQNPNAAAEQEARDLVAKVGQLIVLPEGEVPTIATVNDPEKLKGQAFFAKAKTGDKVLIYTNAKKAILYDPVAHKIVEVAPLNIGAAAVGEPAPVAPTTETPAAETTNP